MLRLELELVLVAIVATLAVGGCASSQIPPDARPSTLENQLVDALLAAAGQEGRVSKVLLAPDLPPGIKGAVARARRSANAKSNEIAGLGQGQLLVQSATLGHSQATITAILGPVPRPQPNLVLLACGTGFAVTFNLVGGQWRQGDLQTLEC